MQTSKVTRRDRKTNRIASWTIALPCGDTHFSIRWCAQIMLVPAQHELQSRFNYCHHYNSRVICMMLLHCVYRLECGVMCKTYCESMQALLHTLVYLCLMKRWGVSVLTLMTGPGVMKQWGKLFSNLADRPKVWYKTGGKVLFLPWWQAQGAIKKWGKLLFLPWWQARGGLPGWL